MIQISVFLLKGTGLANAGELMCAQMLGTACGSLTWCALRGLGCISAGDDIQDSPGQFCRLLLSQNCCSPVDIARPGPQEEAWQASKNSYSQPYICHAIFCECGCQAELCCTQAD